MMSQIERANAVSAESLPPVLVESNADAGCWLGCIVVCFLALFVPLAVWGVDGANGLKERLLVALIGALVPTAGGVGVSLVFAAIDNARTRPARMKHRQAVQELRQTLCACPPMSDAEFCTALPACDIPTLKQFRVSFAEYLGVPPEFLRPDQDLRLSGSEGCVSGLWYCLVRAGHRRFDPSWHSVD